MIKLRPYQQKLIAAIRTEWQRRQSVLAVLPTGGGKTVCFASVIHDHRGASAAVAHRKEIVGQISLALAALEVRHRVIAPPAVVKRIRRRQLKRFGRSFVDPTALAGVVSVQTLTSKASGRNADLQRWVRQVTLAVFDEGHHYVRAGLWGRAVEALAAAKQLFVTATPERADGQGLGRHADGFVDAMVEGPTTRWLIDQGSLCGFVYKAPATDLDVSGVAVTASGDLNVKALRSRVVESHLVGDVVKQYRQYAAGKRAIVFATDVATAEDLAAAFRAADVRAVALSGETDGAVRDRTLDEFEGGQLDVLVNVDLFDEGFDVPAVEAVIMARPTLSLAKYLQMVGRALRPAEGKPHAIIIDPVRNWERHGMPDWPRKWTLDGREKGSRGSSDTIPQRVCLECTQPYERFHPVCPYCGAAHEPAGRATPEQVDGDLIELDVEAMAALFARMQAADMDDDEYALDQLRRNIPQVGRRQDMRRHQAARHRRKVLRELVGWWMGCQPADRTLSEKYRRFYHRFGVDVGTAFTLKADDTNALIERIQKRFAEDMTA